MKNICILTKRFFCQNINKSLRILVKKKTKDNYKTAQFADSKVVRAFGGNGGDGAICLLKEFCNPNRGPSGGDGGNGGHVIFKACSYKADLKNISSIIKAQDGRNGMSKSMDGASGEHTYVNVPVGTFIKCFNSKIILSDLIREDDIYIAVRGGQGGKGNKFFLSQEHRAPTIAERGAEGEEKKLIIEVKLLADIGLIGIPNAGKSTLLRCLTKARPKVADYAFTTIKPHIGNLEFDDKTIDAITICDIPGIIKDAHKNYGLGLDFLRHIERCHILAFILDLHNNPVDQYCILLNELHSYRPMLLALPRLIICNKMDLKGTRLEFDKLNNYLLKTKDTSRLIAISALNLSNLSKVISEMKYLKHQISLHKK